MQDEMIRVQLLDWDHKKVDAGYSPNVMLQQSQWCEATGFTGSHVNWRGTLEAPATTCLCFVCRASLCEME